MNLADYVPLGWTGWHTARIATHDLDDWVRIRMKDLPPVSSWAHIRKEMPDGSLRLQLHHADAARVVGEWLRNIGGQSEVLDMGVRKVATVQFNKVRLRQSGDTPAEALLRVWIQRLR